MIKSIKDNLISGVDCNSKDKRIMKKQNTLKDFHQYPDNKGFFGQFGGQFISETLMQAVLDLSYQYKKAKKDPEFWAAFDKDLSHYVGRPSPLYFAQRLSHENGGAKIYLKREDLNHTGAHKINNTIGQALLAKRIGKKRIIAETGAGQHGVATATIAARLGLACEVYMGSKDIARQAPNVYRMKLLGAKVNAAESGSQTLKDALNEALRDWVTHVDDTFYVIGTVAGPHPYPEMVRDFNSVIGREARRQILAQAGRLPNALVACIGGGSNAMGLFHEFLNDESVAIYGAEAAGKGLDTDAHAMALQRGRVGVLHGNKTYLMCDDNGQVTEPYSISAGLDYPGVGPEHAFLQDSGRATYVGVSDEEALAAFRTLCTIEGIIPALESAHALAYGLKLAKQYDKDDIIIVNLSGRGDKDINTIAQIDGVDLS